MHTSVRSNRKLLTLAESAVIAIAYEYIKTNISDLTDTNNLSKAGFDVVLIRGMRISKASNPFLLDICQLTGLFNLSASNTKPFILIMRKMITN